VILRLFPLWAVFLLPLAFWAPFEDAFKLPQSVLAVALALFLAVAWAFRPGRPRTPILVPVLALAGGYFLSAVLGGMTRPSDAAVFLALALSSVLLAGLESGGKKLVSAMVLAGTLSSLYSIFQFAGLDLLPSPGTGAGLRPFSTMGNPDFLAAFLLAVLPVAVFQWMSGRSAWSAVQAGSMVAALLLTQSRGAWLGAVAGMVSVPFLLYRTGTRLQPAGGLLKPALVLLLVAAGFFSLHGPARERLSRTFSTGHFDAAGRLFMWKAGLGMVRERPVTGTGPGGFGMAYPAWHARGLAKNPGFPWFYTENAHNDFIQLPAELGIPVFGLLAWVWVIFVWMALRLARAGDRIALGLLVGFISLQVDALFNFPWYIVPTLAWFWVSLAVLAGGTPGGNPGRNRGPILPAVLAGLALVFALFRDVQANAWLKLSGDYLLAGRNPEARLCADNAVKRWAWWEGRTRGYNNASLASYSMDDFASAEKYSLASLALAPQMPASISQLALVQARMGNVAAAEKNCREALQLNPHQAEAWHVLGNLAFMRRDLRGAQEAWEKAYAENPSIPGLSSNLEALRRGKPGKSR
jgi:O-antigen ligase